MKDRIVRVSVALSAELHRELKMLAAANDDFMDEILRRAVEDYVKRAKRTLPAAKKQEIARVNRITTALTNHARELFDEGMPFTVRQFFNIAIKANKDELPSREDMIFLREDRLRNMFTQKSGTAKTFESMNDGRFAIRRSSDPGEAQKPSRKRKRDTDRPEP